MAHTIQISEELWDVVRNYYNLTNENPKQIGDRIRDLIHFGVRSTFKEAVKVEEKIEEKVEIRQPVKTLQQREEDMGISVLDFRVQQVMSHLTAMTGGDREKVVTFLEDKATNGNIKNICGFLIRTYPV